VSLRKQEYRERIIDDIVKSKLASFGAVCIEGPKWCGKTWTALNHSNSVFFIGDPHNNFQNRLLAEVDPSIVLDGLNPRLIDEWQEVPSLWDAVRFEVDKTKHKGQFILTGSSTPKSFGVLHSGTGRIDRIMMRPMSLYESGDSDGSVSLRMLFANTLKTTKTDSMSLSKLAYLATRGGWPGSLGMNEKQASDIAKSYLKSILADDITKIDGVKRDSKKVKALIKSLARNVATSVSNATLIKDIKEFDGDLIDPNTIASYLDILTRLFIIDNQQAYDINYRSSTRVAKSPKRHFIDPSLAVAALEMNPSMLLKDLNLFGFIFESLVIRDLKIYAEANRGSVYHFRHHDTGDEIDAVIELDDGTWGAFEIKLGHNQVDKASENLLKIKMNLDQMNHEKSPTVLCVICGLGEYAYKRPDGVFVVPIGCLRE
jgi:predicted AAA+ superfamily ATPase